MIGGNIAARPAVVVTRARPTVRISTRSRPPRHCAACADDDPARDGTVAGRGRNGKGGRPGWGLKERAGGGGRPPWVRHAPARAQVSGPVFRGRATRGYSTG